MTSHANHKTRTLWLTGVLHGFTHLYQVALLPLYLRIQQDLKLSSVEQATLLVTVMGLAYFIPSYPLGALADRLSRKKLLAAGLAINSLGFIGLSLAPSYGWALASMVVAGFGGSFYHPAATALIARVFPAAKGRALGLVGTGASVGFCIGPIYSGWRAVMTGHWRTPVLELGLLGLMAAGLFAWLAEEEGHAEGGRRKAESDQSLLASAATVKERLFPTAALWAFFLATSLAFSLRDFAGSAMGTASSLFLQKARSFDSGSTGLVLSGIFAASVISNPLFGHLSDRSRIRWLTVLLLASAALIALFPHVSVSWMIPVLLAYGFFFIASYPINEAALMEAVHESVRGRVFGLFLTICGLIANLSHWLVGDWVHKLGSRASVPGSYFRLYTILALMVVASLSALPFLHALRKREEEIAPSVASTEETIQPARGR